MAIWTCACKWVLAAILVLAGLGKLVSGMGWSMQGVFYAGLGTCEVVLAILLVRQLYMRVVVASLVAIAGFGAAQALMTPAPCRCFGSLLVLSWRGHLALSCIIGLLTASVIGGLVDNRTHKEVSP